jgi:hypothetical protein
MFLKDSGIKIPALLTKYGYESDILSMGLRPRSYPTVIVVVVIIFWALYLTTSVLSEYEIRRKSPKEIPSIYQRKQVNPCSPGTPTPTSSTPPAAVAPAPTPSYSVQVGQFGVNVGQLTSSALWSSVSSALDSVCPTPVSGTTQCSGTSGQIQDVGFVNMAMPGLSKGELVVSVDSSQYDSPGMRNDMITLAANTAMAGATGTTNCVNQMMASQGYRASRPVPVLLCNAPSFAGVQFYNGSEGSSGWMDVRFQFESASGDAWSCAESIEYISSVLGVLPGLGSFLSIVLGATSAACANVQEAPPG